MAITREEYQQAKRIKRVTTTLVFITIYVLPFAVLFALKLIIPKHAGGLTLIVAFLLIVSLAPLGAYDTLQECSEIIKKYKKGW